LIQKASLFFAAVLLTTGSLIAQSTTVETPLDKQLSRIELGVSGVGEFNKTVSGPVLSASAPNYKQNLTEEPSNTLGALVNIRYTARPYIGLEFNYGYSRYVENISPPPGTNSAFGIQSNVLEYTLGYSVKPNHTFFGFQPFVSGGAGTIEFKPTTHGGEELPKKARMAYYYNVGLQKEYFGEHFGLRAQVRQVFFLAPDFGQNYLTILKHTSSFEPGAGFYLRF